MRAWLLLAAAAVSVVRPAASLQAPVLPIAVAGTRNAMAKGTFRFLRARALAQVLEPIDTTGMTMDDIGRLKQMARERIDTGRRALAAELGIAMPPLATETVSAA